MPLKTDRKVSVVLPVYNGEDFVETAILSVLNQTYQNIELIAINDGSSDNSLCKLRSFKDKIRIISQENTGVAAARNRGIASTSSDYIAFIDQDDYWSPNKIKKQVEAMDASPTTGLCHTGVIHIDTCSGLEVPPLNPESEPHKLVGRCTQRLLINNAIYNSSVMISRSAITKVGMCDQNISGNTVADLDLWLRISRHFDFSFIDKELTFYRLHPNQGLMNRPTMLAAELALLEAIPVSGGWESRDTRKTKLSALTEALGVALLDRGEKSAAAKYFYRSILHKPSKRNITCFLGSLLPKQILSHLRSHNS